MNKKSVIILVILTLLSVVLNNYVLRTQRLPYTQSQVGRYLFEKTNISGAKLGKIIVKSQNFQVTLFMQDKFWRVKEADNYYADLLSTNQLINNINNSKIAMVSTEKMQAKETDVEVITYDVNDNILDDIIIGSKQNNYYQVKEKESQSTFLATGNFILSTKLPNWLQQPLFSLMKKNIKSIILQSDTGQQIVFKPDNDTEFYTPQQKMVDINNLVEAFTDFRYLNVRKEENTPTKDTKAEKIIVLYTDTGIIYKIDVFNIENNYWIQPQMEISKLPLTAGYNYYQDSKMLYNGWIFKIDSGLGQFLSEYIIK